MSARRMGVGRASRGSLLVLTTIAMLVFAMGGRAYAEGGCSRGLTDGLTEPSVIESIGGAASWSTGGGRSVLEGEGFEFATAVTVGDQPAAAFEILSDDEIEFTAPAEDQYGVEHEHEVEIVVTTPGGQSYSCPPERNRIVYVTPTPPTGLSIDPQSGPEAGGTVVMIEGTGLTQNEVSPSAVTAVDFGSTPATSFEALSSRKLRAVAPPGKGSQSVTVTTAAGTSPPSNSPSFQYLAPPPLPEVVFVEPAEGPLTGGNTVEIWAHQTSGLTAVMFGSHPATSFKTTGAAIEAVVPAGTGTVDVRLTASGGTSPIVGGDRYAYTSKPTVTSIEPASGRVEERTRVRITGTGFSGVTSVHFGAVETEVFEAKANELIVYSPFYSGGPGTVDVTVSASGGMSAANSADRFTYLANRVSETPTVSPLPGRGSEAGGQTVTLTGNFEAVTAVDFGAAPASSFEVLSEDEIKAVVPPGHGTVDVTVLNTAGASAAQAKDRWQYYPRPAITSLSPPYGFAYKNEDTLVRVHGEHFLAPLSVTEDGRVRPTEVLSETELSVSLEHGAGTVELRAEDAGGTSPAVPADVFDFVAQPQISSIAPSQGVEEGGTTVTIRGLDLGYSPVVRFGSATASLTHVSEEEIVALAPAGSGTVDVTVTGENGESLGAYPFTYYSPSTLPRFGRCAPVPAGPGKTYSGGFTDKNCKKPSPTRAGKYEWSPGLASPNVSISGTTLTLTQQSTRKEVLTCTSASGAGEFEGATKLTGISIVLHGCKSGALSCESGGTAGQITTLPLQAVPGWISEAAHKAALELAPVSGTEAIRFSCGEEARTISSAVYVAVKIGKVGMSIALPFKSSSKGQKPAGFGGGAEPSSWTFGEHSPALVTGTLTIKAEEPFELSLVR
jgi:hypothetical protein